MSPAKFLCSYNYEYCFYHTVKMGLKNAVSNKVKTKSAESMPGVGVGKLSHLIYVNCIIPASN